MEVGTVEYCAIGRKKAILECLLVVARLEGVLFCNNVMDVLACEQCYLVATVAVEDTEERQAGGMVLSSGRG